MSRWLKLWTPAWLWSVQDSVVIYEAQVEESYTHRLYPERNLFTQGLVLSGGGCLTESSGLYGRSQLEGFDLKTGEVVWRIGMSPNLFGEGVAVIEEALYQLTWREGVLLEYWTPRDCGPAEEVRRIPIDFEGWGLASDGERLYASTGQDYILEIPLPIEGRLSFNSLEKHHVTCMGRKVWGANAMHYDKYRGTLWANIYGRPFIMEISLSDFKCISLIDITPAMSIEAVYQHSYSRPTDMNAVPNGVAVLEVDRFLITGKLWDNMYIVRLEEMGAAQTILEARTLFPALDESSMPERPNQF